jgi:hypothetical protein
VALIRRIVCIWNRNDLIFCGYTTQGQADEQGPPAGFTAAAPEQGAHPMGRKSKRGGAFFMTLHNKHDLEGFSSLPVHSGCTSIATTEAFKGKEKSGKPPER